MRRPRRCYTRQEMLDALEAIATRQIPVLAQRLGIPRCTIYDMAYKAERMGIGKVQLSGSGSKPRGSISNPQRFAAAQTALDQGLHLMDFAEAEGISARSARYWLHRAARAKGLLVPVLPRGRRRQPSGAVDTGLRVIDDTSELLYPDGRREPAPPNLWQHYLFDYEVAGRELRIKLLRPAAGSVPRPVAALRKRPTHSEDVRVDLLRRARRMFEVKTSPQDAASELGVTDRTIQRWYRQFAAAKLAQ